MNFSKARVLSSDMLKLLKQIYENQSVSNLEKDLLKEKLRALYEAIDEEPGVRPVDIAEVELPLQEVTETVSPVREPEPVRPVAPEPVQTEIELPANASFAFIAEPAKTSLPVEEEIQVVVPAPPPPPPQPVVSQPAPEAPVHRPAPPVPEELPVRIPEPEAIPEPPVQSPPPAAPEPPPVSPVADTRTLDTSEWDTLFSVQQAKGLSDRLNASPIADLTKILGLNDRLLTIKDLFGGDRDAFDKAFRELNDLSSFEDARIYMITHLVNNYQWADKDRKDKARQLIQLIRRRYLHN